jgi:Icc protein
MPTDIQNSRADRTPEMAVCPADSGRTIRVVQLTDLHVFKDPGTRLKGIPTRESLADVVDHVGQLGLPVDHLVVTGDHTHDEHPDSYRAVKTLLSPWADRLWQVPGNHDDRTVLRSVFSDRISGQNDDQVRFSFQTGCWLCLGLDTHVPGAVPGLIEASQVAWTADQIAKSQAGSVAIFLHHPPVDVGSLWMDPIGLAGREELVSLIKSESRIRLVCCGHVHHEFESRVGQAVVVTTPATGLQFSPRGLTPTTAWEAPGFRLIEFEGTEFRTRVVRLPVIRYQPVPD